MHMEFPAGSCRIRALVVLIALLATAVAGMRPVDRYHYVWTGVGGGPGFGSPYVGNGDIGEAPYPSCLSPLLLFRLFFSFHHVLPFLLFPLLFTSPGTHLPPLVLAAHPALAD